MAKAVLKGGLDALRTLKLAHTAAVEAGEIIASGGQVLVACNAYEADEEGAYVFRGPIEVPKQSALAIGARVVCYFDTSAEEADTTDTNVKMGIARKAAAAADTTVLVELAENT